MEKHQARATSVSSAFLVLCKGQISHVWNAHFFDSSVLWCLTCRDNTNLLLPLVLTLSYYFCTLGTAIKLQHTSFSGTLFILKLVQSHLWVALPSDAQLLSFFLLNTFNESILFRTFFFSWLYISVQNYNKWAKAFNMVSECIFKIAVNCNNDTKMCQETATIRLFDISYGWKIFLPTSLSTTVK